MIICIALVALLGICIIIQLCMQHGVIFRHLVHVASGLHSLMHMACEAGIGFHRMNALALEKLESCELFLSRFLILLLVFLSSLVCNG
jgi:hypothetical protein